MKRTTVTREELYDLIWSKPITHVAKELEISDSAIIKICKKLDIPRPEIGYWAKLHHNKPVKKFPLKPAKNDTAQAYNFTIQKKSNLIPKKDKIILPKIQIPKELTKPHPLIKKTITCTKKYRINDYGRIPVYDGCLNIKVSPAKQQQALIVMDLILKHFESSDATIINSHACTSIKINGEEVRIAIVEKSIRKSHIMSELEKLELKMGRGYSIPTWDYTPSGFLSLVLEGNIYDAKYFTESHKKSIESLLSIFIDRIILKAEEIKKERIEREEKQKQSRLIQQCQIGRHSQRPIF